MSSLANQKQTDESEERVPSDALWFLISSLPEYRVPREPSESLIWDSVPSTLMLCMHRWSQAWEKNATSILITSYLTFLLGKPQLCLEPSTCDWTFNKESVGRGLLWQQETPAELILTPYSQEHVYEIWKNVFPFRRGGE